MRGHFPAPYKSLHNLHFFDPGMQKVVQILARNARETFGDRLQHSQGLYS